MFVVDAKLKFRFKSSFALTDIQAVFLFCQKHASGLGSIIYSLEWTCILGENIIITCQLVRCSNLQRIAYPLTSQCWSRRRYHFLECGKTWHDRRHLRRFFFAWICNAAGSHSCPFGGTAQCCSRCFTKSKFRNNKSQVNYKLIVDFNCMLLRKMICEWSASLWTEHVQFHAGASTTTASPKKATHLILPVV
jgi:hypothetical protein